MTTSWVERAVLVGVVVVLFAAVLLLMRRGWRARARRQADIPMPSGAPVAAIRWLDEPVDGRYLSSTRAGDWLDRIVVHSMGVPSRARIGRDIDGVWIERQGAADLFIPAASLIGARLDRGIAGKVYEQGGIVTITWRLGGTEIDTGFRADAPVRHQEVVADINAVLAKGPSPVRPASGGVQ